MVQALASSPPPNISRTHTYPILASASQSLQRDVEVLLGTNRGKKGLVVGRGQAAAYSTELVRFAGWGGGGTCRTPALFFSCPSFSLSLSLSRSQGTRQLAIPALVMHGTPTSSDPGELEARLDRLDWPSSGLGSEIQQL